MIGHVASREGANAVRLQQPIGATFTGAPFVIRRAFRDIQTWENAREGDLVAEQRVEVGVLYDDEPSAAGLLAGTLGDFGIRNSIVHDGGTGVRIDRPNATGSVANCTVFAMSGWGVREGSGLLDVRNTIAMAGRLGAALGSLG